MNDVMSPSSKRKLSGTTYWVVVGGLAFLVYAFLVWLLTHSDRLTVLQYLFRLDFRYWFPSLAYPLWLICALLAFDALTYRTLSTNTSSTGIRNLRYESVIFSVKVCLAIIIVYLLLGYFIDFHKHWFWWYPAHLLLFAVFIAEWFVIYQARNRTDFTTGQMNLRKRFLTMSLTVACVLGLYDVVYQIGLIHRPFYPVWRLISYGDYSHRAVLIMVSFSTAICITAMVIKEWVIAIRHIRKDSHKESIANLNKPSTL